MKIKTLIQSHFVFVDTCSFMHPQAKRIFLEDVEGIIDDSRNRIIIPYKVDEEINKLIRNTNQEKASRAKAARELVDVMIQEGKIKVFNDGNDTYVDNLFSVIFTKNRLRHNLCLITQDKALSIDILNLKNSKSVKFQKSIIVLYIGDDGFLKNFSFTRNKPEAEPVSILPLQKEIIPFPKARVVSKTQEEELAVTSLPREGSLVYLEKENKSIKLGKRLGDGKEGIIYETDRKNLVCKILKDGSRTSLKRNKLKLMTSKNLRWKGICWPISLVYNSYLEFVGFSMPRATGVELYKVVHNKGGILEEPINWEKMDLVRVCIDLMNKIRILHEYNVLIGNINLWDILVTKEKTTCLIDTDSYQVGKFPCVVGRINFTAPEIQGEEFRKFLRKENDENFAIATLLFMILMLGQTPYAQQDGISSKERILNKEFPYPFGKVKSSGIPPGPWRFIWSHLPFRIKEAFFNTFRLKTKKRLNVEEWIYLLKGYRNNLRGQFVSNELYPADFKEVKEQNQPKEE